MLLRLSAWAVKVNWEYLDNMSFDQVIKQLITCG